MRDGRSDGVRTWEIKRARPKRRPTTRTKVTDISLLPPPPANQSFSPLNTKHEWKSSPQQSRESDANRLFDSICHIASHCKLHRWIIKERTHVTCCCRFEETGRFSSVFGVATTTTGSNACCPSLSRDRYAQNLIVSLLFLFFSLFLRASSTRFFFFFSFRACLLYKCACFFTIGPRVRRLWSKSV